MHEKSVFSSLIFKFTERILVKSIGFFISVVLARILEPELFGVVAIVMAIVSVAQTFVDSGLSTALVQNEKTQEDDYSTVFYISMAIALLLYAIIYFLTPFIAGYYDIVGYQEHIRILSLMLVFYALNSIQTSKLQRNMQFKNMLICQIISSVISGTVGVGMAYSGYGIWALVFYYLSNSIVTCVTCSIASKWYPKPVFSVDRAKEFFSYGSKILGGGLLCSLFANIRTFIIGRAYSTTELGLYSRGEQIPSIISTTIDGVFNSVMLPVFSRKQNSLSDVREMLKSTITVNSYLNFPMMLGMVAVAPAAVVFLYTEKWSGCIPYLQLISIANLVVSISPPCLVAIKAIGRSDVFLKLEIIRRTVMVFILLISLCVHSLIAIAIGWVISSIVDTLIVLVATYRLVEYSLWDVVCDVGPSFVLSVIMAAVVWGIGHIDLPVFILLMLQIGCGITLYVGLSIVTKAKCYVTIKNMIVSHFVGH